MAGPYLVVDAATGETLLQRDPGAAWYPASLTKLMTMYLVFEELKAGRLQPATPVAMSKQRAERGVCRLHSACRPAARSPSTRAHRAGRALG